MKLFYTLLLGIMAVAAGTSRAAAHGGTGTQRLVNEPAGPYLLSAWTEPEPVEAGEPMHVTVAVSLPGEGGSAGEAVLGADVRLRLAPENGAAAPVEAVATNEKAANKLFYEADLVVPAGAWLVEITVTGPEGQGISRFPLAVVASTRPAWPLWVGAGALVMAAGLAWLWRKRQ